MIRSEIKRQRAGVAVSFPVGSCIIVVRIACNERLGIGGCSDRLADGDIPSR
ncbi:hypothetical protein D3C71_2119310 [compost metagenome]